MIQTKKTCLWLFVSLCLLLGACAPKPSFEVETLPTTALRRLPEPSEETRVRVEESTVLQPLPSAESTTALATSEASAGPSLAEVHGIQVPSFSLRINALAMSQAELAILPLYAMEYTFFDAEGQPRKEALLGYKLQEVFRLAQAHEGSELLVDTLAGERRAYPLEVLDDPLSLVVVQKNGVLMGLGPWLVPGDQILASAIAQDVIAIAQENSEPSILPAGTDTEERDSFGTVPSESRSSESEAGP